LKVNPGRWTRQELDRLLGDSFRIADAGGRIEFLSRQFLGTPYGESTLEGDVRTPEVLVIDLAKVDCFTFIDYMEAMRRSRSFGEFTANLRSVRYRSGLVSFASRNHFFTDWIDSNQNYVRDVTAQVSGGRAATVSKVLNEAGDGRSFVAGIPAVGREITYIPPDAFDASLLGKLRTGDYAGIYSPSPGLDVSHVGIVAGQGDALCLRHASSAPGRRRVIDEDLAQYIKGKPGLMVLRPNGNRK